MKVMLQNLSPCKQIFQHNTERETMIRQSYSFQSTFTGFLLIILNSPVNSTYQQSGSLINFSISDSLAGIDTVWYEWDNNGTFFFLSSPYELNLISGDGLHSLSIFANDSLNNNITVDFEFTSDDTSPSISLLNPLNESVLQSSSNINLDFSDTNNIADTRYYWDDQIGNTTLTSPYIVILPEGDGTHILHVYSMDEANNWAHKQFIFTTDDTAPEIDLTRIIDGSIYAITGTGLLIRPNTTIAISITEVNILVSTIYNWDGALINNTFNILDSVQTPPSEGNHTLKLFIEDEAGNWGTKTFIFTIDGTKPTISDIQNTVGKGEENIELTVRDNYEVQTVLFAWDSDSLLTYDSESSNIFIPTAEGEHQLLIKAIDLAGNELE